MLDTLQLSSEVLEITVKKATEMTLTIPKNGKLGLNLAYAEGKSYVIVKGIHDGAVKDYNSRALANKQLKVPSRIIKVDGVTADGKELFKKLQEAADTVELT